MTDKSQMSKRKAWLIILISLADDVVILAVVIAALWYFKVKLPIWAMIVIGLALGSFIFIRTWAILPSLRKKKITGAEGMMGEVGEVVESLSPKGIIKIGNGYWHAKSVDGDIEAGEDVEILGMNRLNLEVKRKISWEQ